MKKRFISTIAIGIALSGISAFAEEGTAVAVPTLYVMPVTTSSSDTKDVVVPSIEVPSSVSPVTERAEVIGAKSNTRIQARGAQLIKERVKSLNQNAEAVAKAKGLTADQKTAFSMFFSGKVVELNALGVKIASSTEASSTKALVSSIFTDFRVYAIVLPQVRLQKRIYEVQNHIAKLSETFVKVQTKIDEAKANGKDVTVWQKNLDDAKTLVTTDTTKLTALMTQINALKPSDYGTTSKSTIETVNSGVKSVAKDLNSIGKKVRRPENMKKVVNSTSTQTTSNSLVR